MRSLIAKLSKEILLEKQEAHITSYRINQLQHRLDQAFKNDQSHTRRLAEN